MNLQKNYTQKTENLLLAPIYKLNFGPKSSQESQTSATGSGSDHSLIKIQKNMKKNKTYSFLNFQTNKNILTTYKFEKNNLIYGINNNKNLIPNLLSNRKKDNYIDSVEIMNFTNNKSRNNKLLNNINTFNIRSTNDLRVNSTLNNYQTQIQKILKKHKINLMKRKLEVPNLLIKDTDITKKRYYFGFMSFENENKENSNNKNILNENQFISNSPNLKKKILPLKKKPKISIDELIKKKQFPENIEKKIIEKIKNPQKLKLKLKPLKKTVNIKVQELKKRVPENNKTNNDNKLLSNDNLQKNLKLTQCKSFEKINNESITQRSNFKAKTSILKTFNKKLSLSSKVLPKVVKFESKPINLIEKLENKKKFIEEKEIQFNEINENETKFGFNFDIEEKSSREYEEDNDINSEDNFLKKRKKILKEKKKFSNRISSSTLNLNKPIIESYEFFNFSNQEKKFLIQLYPEISITKKLLSNNYNQVLTKSKKHIKELITIKQKNLFDNFKFKIEMFLKCKNELDEINTFLFDHKVLNLGYYGYLNIGLNTSISYHFMNLYLPMSPQIIDNFLTAKPEGKDKDCKYIFTNKVNMIKRKSVPDIHNQLIYNVMALKKENLVFYQNFIYIDYIDDNISLTNIKNLIKKERYSKEEKDIEKKNSLKKKKNKKKVNLQLLRKKFFFKMEGKQRQIMNSQFDIFLKSEDIIVQTLLENINEMIKKSKSESKLISSIIILLDYCIKHKSTSLFIAIHHRYHKFFNLNSVDKYQNNDTLLIKATKEKSKGIVKYLLEKGADPNICNEFGNTAIHYALSYKYFEIADILRKNGANENIENNKGLISWECINQKCE